MNEDHQNIKTVQAVIYIALVLLNLLECVYTNKILKIHPRGIKLKRGGALSNEEKDHL